MPNHDYDASITDRKKWSWNGDDIPPDVSSSGGRLGGDPLYIFKRGDTLVLRVAQEHGPHKIELRSDTYTDRTPFAYPFDLHTFIYNPDDPDQKLICTGRELLGAGQSWTFSITGPSGVKIDPEFQVGVGGHPPADPEGKNS